MRRRVLPLLALALLLPASCFRPRSTDPEAEPPRIQVRSRYLGPVVVYLRTGGNAVRLGMIQSNRTETYDFPVGVNPYGPGIRLVADPIGDFEAYISETITVTAGTTIVFTIENELRHSNVIVR